MANEVDSGPWEAPRALVTFCLGRRMRKFPGQGDGDKEKFLGQRRDVGGGALLSVTPEGEYWEAGKSWDARGIMQERGQV